MTFLQPPMFIFNQKNKEMKKINSYSSSDGQSTLISNIRRRRCVCVEIRKTTQAENSDHAEEMALADVSVSDVGSYRDSDGD